MTELSDKLINCYDCGIPQKEGCACINCGAAATGFYDEYPLPPWAEKRSDGTYMELGAQLCARDGRRCGNAFVDRLHEEDYGLVADVITDAGTTIRLIQSEAEGMFHPPAYVMKLDNARRRFKIKEFTDE